MVRPVHVCCGLVFRQPQSTVLMAYQPGGSGAPVFSPTVSPGCVTDPARAGMAVQSDRAPAAANFVNVPFICSPPLAWPQRRRTDHSAEAGQSHSRMQLFDGDPVEAICLSPRARSTLFESCCRNAIRPHSPDAWHWSITQIVEQSPIRVP
jgi:hypothetical protein